MEKDVTEYNMRSAVTAACGSIADCVQRAADGVECDPDNYQRLDYVGKQLALALVIAEDAYEKLQVLTDLINRRVNPEDETYKRADVGRRLLPELTQDYRSSRVEALIQAAKRRA